MYKAQWTERAEQRSANSFIRCKCKLTTEARNYPRNILSYYVTIFWTTFCKGQKLFKTFGRFDSNSQCTSNKGLNLGYLLVFENVGQTRHLLFQSKFLHRKTEKAKKRFFHRVLGSFTRALMSCVFAKG